MTAKKIIPHYAAHRFVRKSVLLSAAMASALGVIAAQTAVAGKPFKVPENGSSDWFEITVTLKPTAITTSSWDQENNDSIFLLDGDAGSNVDIRWWEPVLEIMSEYYSLTRQEGSNIWHPTSGIGNTQNVALKITAEGSFNVGWDFKKNENNNSDNSAFFANFRNKTLDSNNADAILKHFIFDDSSTSDEINVVTRNSVVRQTNSGDSNALIGLSLSNKRGWITFEDSTSLISDFYFDYTSQQEDNVKNNAEKPEYIASGVYTAFGAYDKSIFEDIFLKNSEGNLTTDLNDEKGISKYGLIEFNKHSVVSVTATDMPKMAEITKANAGSTEPTLLNEAFGVFANEGGSVVFQDGADILVKGRDNHRLVSAIAAASSLGVLDPLKQGEITVATDKSNNTATRIWSWSDNYSGKSPYVVEDAESGLFDSAGKLSVDFFKNLDENLEAYLDQATSKESDGRDQHLRTAVISAHGSTVTLTDEDRQGYFDIRGDIISGIKNGERSNSNTLGKGASGNAGSGFNNAADTVARSYVDVILTNPESTLVGNVYERHRVGQKETLGSVWDEKESFEAWRDFQYEQEKNSLGGNANIVLSNGATWYPVKTWCGWNFDVMSDNFFDGSGSNIKPNNAYELLDKSDQYNLHVYKENTGYDKVNDTWKVQQDQTETNSAENEKEAAVNEDRINDLDLVAEFKDKVKDSDESADAGIPYQNEKTDDYTTVDNGIYHLTLNGGVVDLSYLRKDFLMNTAQAALGATAEDVANAGSQSTLDLDGVKKFRIQALSGEGGTIYMYAKDQANHDLVIIDELRDHENNLLTGTDPFVLNLAFWNTLDKNGEQTVVENLSVDPNDPSTFVHVARVPENVVVHAASYGPGRTTYTYYRVEKDEKNAGENQTEYGEGSWTYLQHQDWHEKNVNWFITDAGTSESDPAVVGTSVFGANLGYLMATAMETMRDRRGEAVYNGSQDDGWWIRYTHNNFGMDDFDAETDGFQMGYEYAESTEDGRVMKGLALDVARADVDYTIGNGKSEANRYRLSAYRTYLADNGFYLDLVGRAGWYDADTDLVYQRPDRTLYSVKGDFDYWAAAASAETGWRYETEKAWWIEPEAQLQFTYIADYDYTSNQGVKVEADDVTSLIGRIGLRVGKVLTRDNGQRMSLWLGADVLHEFDGDREGSMQGYDAKIRYSVSGDDTWCDAVFGMTWETSKDSRLWSTVKHNFGGEQDETWSVNAGATWNF